MSKSVEFVFCAVMIFSCCFKVTQAGGGNAGAPNCWFYQQHFNSSLEEFEGNVNEWALHEIDLLMVYATKNPMQDAEVYNPALDKIVAENSGMFDTYVNNIVQETADLCRVGTDLVKASYKDVSQTPFPLYCLNNLGDISLFYDQAIARVAEELNLTKK